MFRIRSSSCELAQAISIAYGQFAWQPGDCDCQIDFDLVVEPVRGWRQWIHPLIELSFDGERPFAPLPAAQAFPLLEWAMNWCVTTHAHRFMLCHSAVLAMGDRAVILPAPPGSGKSTLCAGLMLSGWRLLSDEMALILPESVLLQPFVRPVSLKNQSISLISDKFPAAVLTPKVVDTIKGTVAQLVPTVESIEKARQLAHPRWLVFPRYVAGASCESRPISKAEAAVELAKNAFNLRVLGAIGMEAIVSLVNRCDCFTLSYGELDDAVEHMRRLVEEDA